MPNAWQILMACNVLWRQVLEPTGNGYPNMTAHEFLSLHGFRHLDGNLCSSRAHNWLVQLKLKYSHAKKWQRKSFFVSGEGWEFPPCEAMNQEFPIRPYGVLFPMIVASRLFFLIAKSSYSLGVGLGGGE